MQVRCQRCGSMHTMSRAALEAAFAELEQAPAKHYNVECPKCRRQIKVPVKQLQRFRPREE
jgi:hypothetical protein